MKEVNRYIYGIKPTGAGILLIDYFLFYFEDNIGYADEITGKTTGEAIGKIAGRMVCQEVFMNHMREWKDSFLNCFRNRKNRFLISVGIGLCAAVLPATLPDLSRTVKSEMSPGEDMCVRELKGDREPALLAWWGTLYPEFCFEKIIKTPDAQKTKNNSEGKRVKLSFWLAKAFDW